MRLVPLVVTAETKILPTNAFHQIAPHILLDSLFARGTLSGILSEPILIIFFLIGQFLPLFHFCTKRRLMRFLFTPKTIKDTTWTLNSGLLNHHIFLAK